MFSVIPSDPGAASAPRDEAPAPSVAHGLQLREADPAGRRPLEAFIAARFAEVYGADLHRFMPRLYGLHGAEGELIAAFGLRSAGAGPLFLEQYLDLPIEAEIAQRVAAPVARAEIAEVGNLAGATPGALRQLIPLLTRLLHRQGHRWVVFTGAARLCNGFSRLGLPLSVMAPAPPERLPPQERSRWGSYYQHSPSVMLGDVLVGQRRLEAMAHSPRALDAALAPVARVGAP